MPTGSENGNKKRAYTITWSRTVNEFGRIVEKEINEGNSGNLEVRNKDELKSSWLMRKFLNNDHLTSKNDRITIKTRLWVPKLLEQQPDSSAKNTSNTENDLNSITFPVDGFLNEHEYDLLPPVESFVPAHCFQQADEELVTVFDGYEDQSIGLGHVDEQSIFYQLTNEKSLDYYKSNPDLTEQYEIQSFV